MLAIIFHRSFNITFNAYSSAIQLDEKVDKILFDKTIIVLWIITGVLVIYYLYKMKTKFKITTILNDNANKKILVVNKIMGLKNSSMKKLGKYYWLALIVLTMSFNTNLAQTGDAKRPDILNKNSLFSSGLHTLSIYERDTIIHDSVFHFLVEKLKLPI